MQHTRILAISAADGPVGLLGMSGVLSPGVNLQECTRTIKYTHTNTWNKQTEIHNFVFLALSFSSFFPANIPSAFSLSWGQEQNVH